MCSSLFWITARMCHNTHTFVTLLLCVYTVLVVVSSPQNTPQMLLVPPHKNSQEFRVW
eukprot:m.1652019 g.1652019  ORF g.1652019 m.1652019 type:complete len:58 (-) comp91969_c0_seq1:26-199(-)